MMSVMNSTAPFAVYVHWPFCLSKCPYCDFNSHVRHGGIDEARFLRAYETEIAGAVAPDVEVTLEANPTSVEAARFRGFRAAGVNRISLGVQSLEDTTLKELG